MEMDSGDREKVATMAIGRVRHIVFDEFILSGAYSLQRLGAIPCLFMVSATL